MWSNCCRAFFLLCCFDWASQKWGPIVVVLFPIVECQKLSFMPTSGRPRDQFLRTFSAFSRLVAVFGLLFQRPFSPSLIDRSIDRSIVPQQNKSSHASSSIQCQKRKKKKNVQNSSPWLLRKWITSGSCSGGVFGMRFWLSSLVPST